MKSEKRNSDYKLEIICDENHTYIASYPELPGCIVKGSSLEKVIEEIQQQKQQWLIRAYTSGEQIPLPGDTSKYSGQFKLRLPRSLHKSLTENAKKEGISLNQYCVYLLSLNEVTRYRKSSKKNYYL